MTIPCLNNFLQFLFKLKLRFQVEFSLFLLVFFFAANSHSQKLDLKDFTAFQGMTIRNITVSVDDVFDIDEPAEDNWLFRRLNALKINTRENVIRSDLLFKENDVFDFNLVHETVRILEAKSYLIDAEIDVVAVDDSQVDIAVRVRDAWTLEPRVSYGREGGESKSGFGLGDGNVFGTGDSVMIAYKSEEEQSSISYSYTKNNLFNRHIVLSLTQQDSSDGEASIIRLEKPFYSLASKFSWGVSSEKLNQIHVIKSKSEDIDEYRGKSHDTSAYAGYALFATNKSTLRLKLGVDQDLADFFANDDSVDPVPASYDRQYSWIETEFIENKFGAYKNLYLINRRENINLGNRFSVRLGIGKDKGGDSTELERVLLRYSSVIGLGEKDLATFAISLDAHHLPNLNRYDSSVFSMATEYHYFINTQNRWYLQLQYDRGESLLPHELLTLGGSEDLRGYPLAFQSGEERYALNIERRFYLSKDWFNLFYLGAVAFADVGKVSSFATLSNGDVLADIGLGLRVIPSKLGNALVVHLDLARPMVDTENTKASYFSVAVSSRF